jgi:hypothetical protein
VGPVIFGWSCSFIVIRIFSICKFGGNVHEFRYCFWLDVTHLLNKIWMAEPDCECIGCSFVRDILYWIFDDALALYVRTEWLATFLYARFYLFDVLIAKCLLWSLEVDV